MKQAIPASSGRQGFGAIHKSQGQGRDAELLELLFESIPVMLTIYEPGTNVLRVNRHFEQLTGWTLDDESGASLMEACYPDPVYRQEAAAFMAACSDEWRDIRLRTKDGLDLETSWANVRLSDDTQVGIGINISERKQAEEALARYRLLYQNARDIVLFIRRTDGQILEANEAALEAYGYDRPTILNLTISDLRPPEKRSELEDRMTRADEVGIRFESQHKRSDGTVFDVEISSRGADVGGQRVLLSIIRDISDRKVTELALARRAEGLRLLSETAAILLAADDPAQLADAIFDKVKDYLGADIFFNYMLEQDAHGLPILRLESAAGIDELAWAAYARMEIGEPVSGVCALKKETIYASHLIPDQQSPFAVVHEMGVRTYVCCPLMAGDRLIGTLSFGSRTKDAFEDDERELIATLCHYVAIAKERLRSERELQQRGELLSAAITATGMGVWRATRSKREGVMRMEISPEIWTMHGLPVDTVWRPDILTEFVLPEDRELVRQTISRAISDRVSVEIEYRIWRDGSIRWLMMNGRPLDDPEFEILTGVLMDITERKEVEERSLEADRRKDEFLATLAHELRNPLAPIQYAVDLMKSEGPPQGSWEVLDRQVRLMARLLDDLMDVSRITQNRLELRREPLLLGELVESAIESCRPVIEENSHAVQVLLPMESVWVSGDRARLTQVLQNLLNNAAKYTNKGGHIWVKVSVVEGQAKVSIRDDGIGIRPEYRARLFEMFSQEETAIERSQGGLGIGLSLVRALMQLHGGTVEALSDGPGKGSEFVASLPVAQAVVAHGPVAQVVQREEPLRRVLVVDDRQDAANVLATMLIMVGHVVEKANDGHEAMEKAERFRPEVVFLDIGLPLASGYEVARFIRSQPWGTDVLLIALTGWGQERDRKLSSEAGFDHHMVKPVSFEQLRALMRSPIPVDDPISAK